MCRRCVFSRNSYLLAIKFIWLHSQNGTLDLNIMYILTAEACLFFLTTTTACLELERVSFISQSKSS